MRRSALPAALAFLAVLVPAAVAAEPLRLASDVWPPFTNAPSGMRFALDLVHAALERSGIEATSDIRPDFEDVMADLRAGRLDGSAALWRDDERETFLLFSRPYLENRLTLLARKGGDVSTSDLGALDGRRIGLVQGYAYGASVEGAEGPILVRGASVQENVDRLLRGELDYVLADELLLHGLFDRYGERARVLLEVGAVPVMERSLHFAVRRDLPGAGDVIARFDAAIAAMIADGSYNRILGVLWIQADLDGDGKGELVLGGDRAGTAAPDAGYPVFRTQGARKAQPGPRYVIDGKTYQNWEQIPTEYRVPVDQESAPAHPGIRLLDF